MRTASENPFHHFLIVGGGGRESAFAQKLAEDSRVSAFLTHENPSITEAVRATGGTFQIGDVRDGAAIARFATTHSIDYAFVSADEPLAAGVVDSLLQAGVKTIGATRQAAKIEWDKIHSIKLMAETSPEHTPVFEVVGSPEETALAIERFAARNLPIVVKPQGLTGGKGVKVMPIHLADYNAASSYAQQLLGERPTEKVLLVEKLEGIEFTIMGLTDGENLVLSPASYDYPFRFENDTGPGTGGMGCFTAAEKHLPFLSPSDIEACERIMRRIIRRLNEVGTPFNGVLNGGFFKTANGIQFMEFNGRFGDPEALNILTVLQGSFASLLRSMHAGTLSADQTLFLPEACVINYLVAPEYPAKSPVATEFTIDMSKLDALEVKLFAGACRHIEGNRYRTLGSSRVIALGATAPEIYKAAEKVMAAIKSAISGDLDYRPDIGSPAEVEHLTTLGKLLESPRRGRT